MAVSYLSQVAKSNPYVLPVDLDLLAKVNSYKQNMFYQNANALKQQYAALKNSDILNPEQKKLLDEKYNNLANQINSWGGVDYSDMGVVNQMEGYANSIYSDPNIIKGIASTKKIRTLMANYEKMKTDPKLMKFYGKANEAYDMKDIGKYISGGLDSTYNGPTTPTPFKGNVYNRLKENLKNIRPDIEVGFNPVNGNPYFIEKSTRKTVSPEKVLADVNGQIDGDLLSQIKIDAWYNMQGVSDEQLEQMYTAKTDNKIKAYEHLLGDYEKQRGLAPNKKIKTAIEGEITKVKNAMLEEKSTINLNDFREKLKTEEGKEQIKSKLYLNDIFDAVIKSTSYTEIDKNLITNVAAVQADKMRMHNASLQNAWNIALMRDKTAREIAAMKSGKKYKLDANGNIVEDEGGGLLDPTLPLLGSNVQELQQLKEGEQLNVGKINAQIDEEEQKVSGLLNSFFLEYAPMAQNDPSYKGKEAVKDKMAYIATLTGKRDQITMEDVRAYLKLPSKPTTGFDLKGNRISLNPNLNNILFRGMGLGNIVYSGPTDDERKYFQNVINAYDLAVSGKDLSAIKDPTFSKSAFLKTYGEYVKSQNVIEGNKAMLAEVADKTAKNITAELATNKKLSAGEKQWVEYYFTNKNALTGKLVDVGVGDIGQGEYYEFNGKGTNLSDAQIKTMTSALKKAGILESTLYGGTSIKTDVVDNFAKGQDKILAEDKSFRQNYYGMPIKFDVVQKKYAQVGSYVKEAYEQATGKKSDMPVDDVLVTWIQQNPTTSKEFKENKPWTIKAEWKVSGGGVTQVEIPVNDDLAKKLGATVNPNVLVETGFNRKGATLPEFVTNTGWVGEPTFKYQIVKSNTGINMAIIEHNGQQAKVRAIPTEQGVITFDTWTVADNTVKGLLQNAHNLYPTPDSFIAALKALEQN